MLLRQLDYFVKVVENNSFTKAAAQAYISQSAISQQIQALEKDLGVDLMVRQHRSFALTPAGEYLYRHAPQLLAQAKELKESTISVGHTNSTHLMIGCVRSYIGPEFNQAVASFNQQHPHLELSITLGNHEELFDALRQEKVDLVFNDQRHPESEAYTSRRIITTQKMVEVSANQSLTGPVTAPQLAALPCYILAASDQEAGEIRYYHEALGITSPLRFATSLREARLMVAANQGWLLTDQLSDHPAVPAAIKLLPFTDPHHAPIYQPYFLFWKRQMTTLINDAFAETLQEQFS